MRKEPVVLIEVPPDAGPSPYLDEVSPGLTPLDILVNRMHELATPDRVVLSTGRRKSEHSAYNRFAAMRRISYFPTNEPFILKRILSAVAISRSDTIVRVCANHVFADPEIIMILLNLHKQHKTAPDYSTLLNAPNWISAEVIETSAIQRGWDMIRGKEEYREVQPAELFLSADDEFGMMKHRAPIRGRWRMNEYTLATQEGYSAILETLRRVGNYNDITYKHFLV